MGSHGAVVSAALSERKVAGSIPTIGDFHTVGPCKKAVFACFVTFTLSRSSWSIAALSTDANRAVSSSTVVRGGSPRALLQLGNGNRNRTSHLSL